MSHKIIYPGSFDPITVGHFDIIKRISNLFKDSIIEVIVADNRDKSHMFDISKRKNMVQKVVDTLNIHNVKVVDYSGVISDYVNENKVNIIIRGIRNYTDLEYEKSIEIFTMSTTNAETIYLTPEPSHSSISSSLVRNFIKFNKKENIKGLVPSVILEDIIKG